MKETLYSILIKIACLLLPSCIDHDDPQLAPIDTTQVKITASVKDTPNSRWLTETEELTIQVSNIELTAPKGVVLRSISLIGQNGNSFYRFNEKPFSGKPLEFKIPLNGSQGRVYFSLRGNLIKKDSRDADIIIMDNIQRIVFSEMPKFDCEGSLLVTVNSKSTSGEEYSASFEAKSDPINKISIPPSKLYWAPKSGTASTVEVTLAGAAIASSPNTTFDSAVTRVAIGHNSGEEATVKFTLPNTPGSLDSKKLQMYALATYYGTWENVTIEPYNLTNVFDIVEAE